MKGLAFILLLLVGFPSMAMAQTPTKENICPAQLGAAMDAIANRPQFRRDRWGILIQTLSTGENLYSREAKKYFIPASNVKLLTTAAALQKFGSQFRIRTSIYGNSNGSLYVVGRGDPSISETQLKDLAKQLKKRGINQVNQLIADDSYFSGRQINPTWESADIQAGYGAPINSLIFNENAIKLILSPQSIGQPLRVNFADATQANQWQVENNSLTVGQNNSEFVDVGRNLSQQVIQVRGNLRVGSDSEPVYVSVINPANNFLQQFRRILIGEGINVKQALVAANSQLPTQELAAIESPIMADLVKETNQESVNIYAEVLLRLLSKVSSNNQDEIGLKELKSVLTQLGVNPHGFVLVDGSGLSRQNLVSPEAFVQTLRLMAKSPMASIYRNSLPVAGVSGTLKKRFKNTLAQGIVQAKTGYLTGASALSGYVNVPNFEPIVFSIIANKSDASADEFGEAIDDMVLLLTRLKRC
ncbi:D-alanyl-D-alanine carboxypeptidase/D-alanyl-D-alanine-endopeptidase [Oscillatoriales cyanobacterium USR001]|nr:D-alanyl-D-alanine carboxypeptidase/D-alanyl-D-alanine-endopeptidase [Oscillatoriales cyanobacterium USR001]